MASHLSSLGDVAKNWALALTGNLLGSFFVAYMACEACGLATVGPFAATAMGMATAKAAAPASILFAKGIMCNWLVCVAVWCATAAQQFSGKALACLLPVSAFIACGFEHSIANAFLVPAGILAGADVTWVSFWTSFVPVLLGNVVGGAVFVGLLFYVAFGEPPRGS